MIKIKIVKNKEIIFVSNSYSSYSSEKTIDWNDLRYADLSSADLSSADLRSADLRYADLSSANLHCTKLDKKEECRKGKILKRKIIGYKKCRNDIIVKLEIPDGAIVFSINNNKCRTNVAKVIDIDNNLSEVISQKDCNFVYKKGKTIKIKDFNLMYNVECASGIHFFKTREEAEKYV